MLRNQFIHFALLLCAFWPNELSAGKSRIPIQEHDPNSQYLCKGELGEHAACLCNDEAFEVACVNAQFVDVHAFHYLNTNYRLANVRKLTFHGNNFQELTNAPLFGSIIHEDLQVLNISANYIVTLHSNALKSTPNINVLDLSNNEIVLNQENVKFLKHTRKLTQLYLRRAFTASVNRTKQFDILMQMFENADLKQLKYLDLSYNFLTSVPYNLGCPFPSLSFLDFRQNMLSTLTMNISCLSSIDSIDLSRNHFHHLDENFRRNFANYMPPQSLSMRNLFYCDCHSSEWLAWFRSTNTIRDREMLTCGKASPMTNRGARLLEVPVNMLDCTVSMENAGTIQILSKWTMLLASLFLCLLR
ncbi:Trophoblast glycoprotein [Aphelenchoides bicaudatus]|nr:Trophoblast glycoprotein [Aphelenchoides bicaudatus]